MHTKYSLFLSHLDLSHKYWKDLVRPGDTVIDATCGNGHDTLALAKLALTVDSGEVFALDLQQKAIDSCKKKIDSLPVVLLQRIQFNVGCHSLFPSQILPNSVKLVVYNLGYLPGGNKELTTRIETTLKSLINAQNLIQHGGAISMTCYPGHEAGEEEEDEILRYASTLDPKIWSCCHHRWLNRRNSPSLLLIQKNIITI